MLSSDQLVPSCPRTELSNVSVLSRCVADGRACREGYLEIHHPGPEKDEWGWPACQCEERTPFSGAEGGAHVLLFAARSTSLSHWHGVASIPGKLLNMFSRLFIYSLIISCIDAMQFVLYPPNSSLSSLVRPYPSSIPSSSTSHFF